MAAKIITSALLWLAALGLTIALLPVARALTCTSGIRVDGQAHCAPQPLQMAMVSGLGSCVLA